MKFFKLYWANVFGNRFEKRALTEKELSAARELIAECESKKMMSSQIVRKLQESFPELSEKYRAETVYWTESKRKETNIIAHAGEELVEDEDVTYKIIPSPGACDVCRKKSGNGNFKFKKGEVFTKDGSMILPFHPNCYCILIVV